jgi:non-canonical (house-cleaning) NTP pyrophosphatase
MLDGSAGILQSEKFIGTKYSLFFHTFGTFCVAFSHAFTYTGLILGELKQGKE